MKNLLHISAIALLFCACGDSDKKEENSEPKDGKDQKEKREPVRIAFGDCGHATTNFESGPRPSPVSNPFEEDAVVAMTDPAVPLQRKPVVDDQDVYGGLGTEVGEMQGGLGYGVGATGPGGGSGLGTIGIANLGSIGNGTGTGYGTGSQGGIRDRKGRAPQIRIGNASATGDLDKNIIRRYIRRKIPRIRFCYEKELLVAPTLSGTLVTQFTITPSGSVQGATASGMDNETVESCVASAIKSIKFPKPEGGGLVNVRYPFTFQPAAGSAAKTPPKQRKAVKAVPYMPGAHNPLNSTEPAIQACLQKAAVGVYGFLAIEMDIKKDGSVTKSGALGVGDATLHTCIAEAAKSVRVAVKAAGTYRCPIAFGNMPLDKAPHLNLTDEGLVYAGKTLASTKEIQESVEWKVPLIEALHAGKRKSATTVKETAVTLSGPLVLRPSPSTPMDVVLRVMRTTALAGTNHLLAAQEGAEWTLLRDVALPVAPVPSGTGGKWGIKGLYGFAHSDNEPAKKISVLLTSEGLWVGTTEGRRSLVAKTGDANDLNSVSEMLAEMRETKFKNRTDIELSAEAAVDYGSAVQVVKLLQQLGFSDWLLTDPQSLSVRFKE